MYPSRSEISVTDLTIFMKFFTVIEDIKLNATAKPSFGPPTVVGTGPIRSSSLVSYYSPLSPLQFSTLVELILE